jgi:uroporphyrinogen decarboxylase
MDSIQGKELERYPVWAMRQAGRYLKEFKKEREGIEFFDFCHMPEKWCEVTLQPIRKFDFDASIIFSDIIILPQIMGMDVELLPSVGPSFKKPIEDEKDIDELSTEIGDKCDKVYDAIFLTRFRLNGTVPLFGFTGGPWTLATYMIEGSSPQKCTNTKKWMFERPEPFSRLISILTKMISEHMINQITAGAQIVQVFESNIGELAEEEFTTFILPSLLEIAESIKSAHPSTPIVIFPRNCHFCYEVLATQSKYDAISIDWTHDLGKVRERVGEAMTLQGNLEPWVLFGTDEVIRERTKKMLDQVGSTKYIANLGWGMLPDHDPEKLRVFVDAVHEYKIGEN